MAEETVDQALEEEEAATPSSPAGGSSLIRTLLAGVGVFVAVIAGNLVSPMVTNLLGTGFVPSCLPLDPAEIAEEESAQATAASGPPTYLSMDPPLVVTFQDQSALRFLQVSIDLVFSSEDAAADAEVHFPVIRNDLIMLLGGRSVAELTSREGKEALRLEAKAEVAAVLERLTGSDELRDLLFTAFVLQ